MTRNAAFDQSVEYLLKRWCEEEGALHTALQVRSKALQREALGRAAGYFRVARSLRRSVEEAAGVARFEFLRQAFQTVTRRDAHDHRFVGATVSLAAEVARQYGGKQFLSLSSKLLWAKYLHPFIIYDSVVRERLGTPRGDYESYVSAWQARYSSHEVQIVRTCERLSRLTRARLGSARDVPNVVGQEWFRRRVLDIYIWYGGA